MSKVYLTSDLHIGHKAICKYRTRFKTTKEHDEYIVNNWNEIIKKRDVVWVLGDMCMKNKDYDMKKIISSLNGNINLITGNHCHLPYYNHNKIKIMNGLIKKYGYWLSHAPIHPQELRGKKNIHGHLHSNHNKLNDERYINVNCEFWDYKPVCLEQLKGE